MPRGKIIDAEIYGRVKKLTDTQRNTGFTCETIAQIVNVSKSTVSRIAATANFAEYIGNRKQNTVKAQLPIKEIKREPASDNGYRFEVVIEDGVAICRMYLNGEMLGQNHGHIFHDDPEGVAQAVSYGFKRLYYKISGKE